MIQAEDRAHRIGQESGCVNIHYLYGAETLDVLLFRKLNEKQNIVSTTLDNKSKDLDVTKIKEQVGDFINMNGKQISVDERKNITQIVDKSNASIKSFLSSKSQNNLININNDKIKINETKNKLEINNNLNVDNNYNNEKENEINNDSADYDKNIFDNVFSGNKNEENNINKDDIIKELNLHKSNRRRNLIKNEKEEDTKESSNNIEKVETEEEKGNSNEKNKKKGKKKRKKKNNKSKSKTKKNKRRNKSTDDINLEQISQDENFINKIFEEENEEKIFGESGNNKKLFDDKDIMNIFNFNEDN
jgi:hypothetical protein